MKKMELTPSVPPKMSSGAQNDKMGPDAVGTPKNKSGNRKHENETVPSKTSPGAKNMKTKSDALGTAENEFGSDKHENETRHPRYRQK
jgi:hypothetical protein